MLALVAPHSSPDPGMGMGELLGIVGGLVVLAIAVYFCWLHVRLVQAFEQIASAQQQIAQNTSPPRRPDAPSPTRNILGAVALLLGLSLGLVACEPCWANPILEQRCAGGDSDACIALNSCGR